MTKRQNKLLIWIFVLTLMTAGLIIFFIPPSGPTVTIFLLTLISIDLSLLLNKITNDKKIAVLSFFLSVNIFVLKLLYLLDIINLLLLIILAVSIRLYLRKNIKS